MIEDALEKHFSRAETSNNEHFAQMEQRFDSLQTELSLLREETLALRADHSALLKHTEKLERTTASLSNSASATDLKLADLEDRSRRNTICLHRLPEGHEGMNVLQFLIKQFCRWSPSLADSPSEIMRATRIGPPRSGGSKLRPLIMQCLHYTVRNSILKAMKETLSLLPDHGESTPGRFPSFPVIPSNGVLIFPVREQVVWICSIERKLILPLFKNLTCLWMMFRFSNKHIFFIPQEVKRCANCTQM